MNPNVVLGLFTWSDDPVYSHREIDIECSRWGNAADTNNAQFVVQPFDAPGHLVRFAVPIGLGNAACTFAWDTNRVSFQSQRGRFSPFPAASNIISAWSYSLEVPQTGDDNVRMNLWLFQGTPPSDQQEVEVIIKSFSFVPLSSPRPAVLDNISRLPSGQVRFDLQGEPDRRYELSASSNLALWQSLGTILATNSVVEIDDTNSAGLDRYFFRAETLP